MASLCPSKRSVPLGGQTEDRLARYYSATSLGLRRPGDFRQKSLVCGRQRLRAARLVNQIGAAVCADTQALLTAVGRNRRVVTRQQGVGTARPSHTSGRV